MTEMKNMAYWKAKNMLPGVDQNSALKQLGEKMDGGTDKTIREKQKEEAKKGEYHTSGLPETIYNASGKSISTVDIDEGNFSKWKGSGDNKYVTATESSDKYKKGERFSINKPKDRPSPKWENADEVD